MANYILRHHSIFTGIKAIELGSGPGLAGLVLARFAQRVILTDYDAGILANCQASCTHTCRADLQPLMLYCQSQVSQHGTIAAGQH